MGEMDFTLCIFVIFLCCYCVSSETYEDREALRTQVLTGYSTDIRPLNDQTEILNISVTAMIHQILSVDAVQGTMKVVVSFACTWKDERITWNPSDHNNTMSLKIYKSKVWIPHITLGNPVEMNVFDEYFMHVTYTSDGQAFYHCGDVVDMICEFDVKFWPFDRQECDMVIFAYDQGRSDIYFSQINVDISHMAPSAEWITESIVALAGDMVGYPTADFKFKLKRQAAYYVMQIILPLIGIGTLSPLVFLLPSESGERVSYSTTILLALAVFLTIIGDNIPKTSNPLPMLILLLAMGVLMALLTTCTVILNLYIFHRDDKKHQVTPFYRTIVRITDKLSCRSNSSLTRVVPVRIYTGRNNNANMKSTRKQSTTSMSKKLTRELDERYNDQDLPKTHPTNTGTETYKDVDREELNWKEVSYAIDKIAFVSTLGMHAIVCTAFMVVLSVGSGS